MVNKIGAAVVIFFACVGKIFGAIPGHTDCVDVFYNFVVLGLCVVRKMCYMIFLKCWVTVVILLIRVNLPS